MNKNTLVGLVIGLVVVLGIGAGLYFTQVNTAKADILKEPVTIMADENNVDEMMSDESQTEELMDETVPTSMMNDGYVAPDFTLMDTKGNSIKLSDLKGEKVYVKYWASWCSICLAGLEDLDEFAAMDNGFKVISIVSPGYKGEQSKEDFMNWFSGVGVENLTVLLDVNGDVASEYGVRAYPTSAYIGSDGVLVKILPGHVDSESIKASMAEIK